MGEGETTGEDKRPDYGFFEPPSIMMVSLIKEERMR
jgi:hypothetical protein